MKTLEQIQNAAAAQAQAIDNGTINAAAAEKALNSLLNDEKAAKAAQERKANAAKDAADKYNAAKAAAKDADKAANAAEKDADKARKAADKAAAKDANAKDAKALAAVASVAEKDAKALRKDADKAANKAANAKLSKERTAQAAKDAKEFAAAVAKAIAPVKKALAALRRIEKAAADKAAKEKAAKDAAARKDVNKAQAEFDAANAAAKDAAQAAQDAKDANKAAQDAAENAAYNLAYAKNANGIATAQEKLTLAVFDVNDAAAELRATLYNVFCELQQNKLFKDFKAEFGSLSQSCKYLRNNFAAVAPIFNVFGVGLEKNDLQPRIFTANWAQDAAKYANAAAALAAAQDATDADKEKAAKAAQDAAKAEKYALSPYMLMPTKNGVRVALIGKKAVHVVNTWNAPTALIVLVLNAAARRATEKDAAAKDAAARQLQLINAAQALYDTIKDAKDAAQDAKVTDAELIAKDAAAKDAAKNLNALKGALQDAAANAANVQGVAKAEYEKALQDAKDAAQDAKAAA